MFRRFFLFMVGLLFIFGGDLYAREDIRCLRCHSTIVNKEAFLNSVHGYNDCVSCHRGITNIEEHIAGEQKPTMAACAQCHKDIAEKHKQGFHYLQLDFRCWDCHNNIHAINKTKKESFKKQVVLQCTKCHANDEYSDSGHAEAVIKRGNTDAATCSDCHGIHDTKVFHTSLAEYPQEARKFYTDKCVKCHSDEEIAKRNNLNPNLVKLYHETYHGKIENIGYYSTVAGCADCHRSHNILPKNDTRSSIHPDNLVKNCGRCHSGFAKEFVSYKAHPDYRDRENYPALYWTFVFMSGLLIFTFGFFWIHTGLWWRKSYWESHKEEKRGIVHQAPPDTRMYGKNVMMVRRFKLRDRILHFILIIVFFTLVITGFPQKYHTYEWAKAALALLGGAHMAGYLHRVAAGILLAEFVFVAVLSLLFLFRKRKKGETVITRLLGPDSLFPNRKDWEDMRGMFLWFFDKGERPRFERWTYWEKFDFWAVFWGMFAIGGSGLLLWKAELSSYIVPGWVLNVATLIHSEEALLATLFIFTVHFFNTHFIPDKFPMDKMIFTGRYTVDEFYTNRPLEFERVVQEGRLEEFQAKHPNIYLKIISLVFGLVCLFTGMALTVLILWSFWQH
ncbi:MAG: cytochrome C [Deltaproteobacteria bacterium]|nr:cytochrome C [Deltaproteobacteria bacterium]